jgi:hypothetical protein
MGQLDRVTVAQFTMEHEARVAAEELESAGITAHLADTEAGTMFGTYVGSAFGGVRLQVAAKDAQVAREILRTHADTNAAEWTCPQCGTHVEAGFELCWNCGAEQGSFDVGEVIDETPDTSPRDRTSEDSSDSTSDQSLEAESAEEELAANDEMASKALRSAIFMFVFPPILLMTSWLIVRLTTLPLSSRGTWRFYLALFFSVVFVLVYSMIFRVMPISF